MSLAPPITAYPKDQQLLMQPGGRWDLVGLWKFWIFAHSPDSPNPAMPQLGWTERGIQTGLRVDLLTQEPSMRIGLQAMQTLGFIDGFILLLVPNLWDPRAPFNDNVLTFPDHT